MSTRFATPRELRTRPRDTRPAPKPAPRKCACGRPIADLRKSDRCHQCEEAETAAQLDREIAEGKLGLTYGPRVRYDLGDAPAIEVPLSGALADWHGLIDAFLASPHQTMRVEGRPPKGTQQSVQTAARRRGLSGEVWAVVRDQQCYLMRQRDPMGCEDSVIQPMGGAM